MRKRISELFGILVAAACMFGLVLVVAPMANATPLDDQNATIVGDRFKYGKNCPPLKLNPRSIHGPGRCISIHRWRKWSDGELS